MIYFSKKLTKKYALDISCFHLIRKFSDGISFFELNVNLDLYEGDHNPQFRILLVFLNFKIFEFEIYNTEHCVRREDSIEELKADLKSGENLVRKITKVKMTVDGDIVG
jgi:hypothetical protein